MVIFQLFLTIPFHLGILAHFLPKKEQVLNNDLHGCVNTAVEISLLTQPSQHWRQQLIGLLKQGQPDRVREYIELTRSRSIQSIFRGLLLVGETLDMFLFTMFLCKNKSLFKNVEIYFI